MRYLAMMFFGLVVAGCAGPERSPMGAPAGSLPGEARTGTNATGLIVTPSGVVAGKVTLVNPNAQYLVVSYPIGVLPEVGRRLNVYRAGLKVGELRISGPQRDVSTVADIIAGEAQVGDEVRAD